MLNNKIERDLTLIVTLERLFFSLCRKKSEWLKWMDDDHNKLKSHFFRSMLCSRKYLWALNCWRWRRDNASENGKELWMNRMNRKHIDLMWRNMDWEIHCYIAYLWIGLNSFKCIVQNPTTPFPRPNVVAFARKRSRRLRRRVPLCRS